MPQKRPPAGVQVSGCRARVGAEAGHAPAAAGLARGAGAAVERLPQPSPIEPQYLPPVGVQVVAVQEPAGAPHTLALPAPPQVCPPGQSPHSRVPPQPSPILPQ